MSELLKEAQAGQPFSSLGSQVIISPTPHVLCNIHLGKFDNSHVSISRSTARTEIHRTMAHSPSLFFLTPGVCGDELSSSQHQLLGPGTGEGQIKDSLAFSIRSPQISLTAGLCRAKPPSAPTYPLFTQ